MRDKIRDTIAERALDGTYSPGTRLKELALAAEFQVSQGPIREALRELEALGLVQSERYRGTRVRSTDMRELREAYELRALIEERSAQLAVPCTPEVLRSLRQYAEIMRRTQGPRNSREYAAAAAAFHHTLVAASGNTAFVRVWESMHWEIRIRIAMQQLRKRKISFDSLIETHGEMLRALERDDGIGAGKLIRTMMNSVLDGIEPSVSCDPAAAPGSRGRAARSGVHTSGGTGR